EPAEAAAVEEEGSAVTDPEVEHPAGHQLVVAGVVDDAQLALHPGQRTVEEGGAGRPEVPGDPGELVATGHGEVPAQGLLVVREDVDGERTGLGDAGPAGRRLGRGQGHQRRVQRQGRERLAGEPHRRPVLHGGDHGDPGGEVAEDLPETGLVERGGPDLLQVVVSGHWLGRGHSMLLPRWRQPWSPADMLAESAVGPEVQDRPRPTVMPSAATDTSSRRLASASRRARPRRRSTSWSAWAGSWWNSSSRFAPASAATRTA